MVSFNDEKLEKMCTALLEKLGRAISQERADDAIDWSIVIKHLNESHLLCYNPQHYNGGYSEPEKNQEPSKTEEAEDLNDITQICLKYNPPGETESDERE